VPHQLEICVIEQMGHVVPHTRIEIIDAKNVVAALQQPLAEMGAEKAGTSGNQDAFWNCLHGVAADPSVPTFSRNSAYLIRNGVQMGLCGEARPA
jgi:GTP-dependent phosphoenolpyruvate carboxykinase